MTWRNRNLYLVGLPGAGKTAIGRELAELLHQHSYCFVDLDEEIERAVGQSVGAIFSNSGEAAFRKCETEALLHTADSHGERRIVATGGGVVLSPINRSIIRGSGIPIWIDVTIREAAKNVLRDILQGHDRPLYRASSEDELREKLREVLEHRRPFYEQATLHFVTRSPRGDERTPVELAQELLTALDEMSLQVALKPRFQTLVAKSAIRDYPITMGSGSALRELAHTIRESGATHIVTVTDSNVEKLYGEEYRANLSTAITGRTHETFSIEAGETAKNVENLFPLLSVLNKYGAGRNELLVVALGGGVVTDLAGFAASIYQRGIPIVHIPTTLLAQCDAAIGGKTGVDHFGRKNIIGSIYPPKQVLVDPLFLKTLPRRELHAGLGEVFKYALIGSAPMWEMLSQKLRRLVRGVDSAYEEIVHDSIVQKLRYIEQDEHERLGGARELLNFGHTFGHALESAANCTGVLHGEAVVFGMRAAAWLSKELGRLNEDAWTEIERTLGRIPSKATVQCDASSVLVAFKQDKKRKGTNRVILLRAIGDAFVTEVSDGDARRAIDYMLSLV